MGSVRLQAGASNDAGHGGPMPVFIQVLVRHHRRAGCEINSSKHSRRINVRMKPDP